MELYALAESNLVSYTDKYIPLAIYAQKPIVLSALQDIETRK